MKPPPLFTKTLLQSPPKMSCQTLEGFGSKATVFLGFGLFVNRVFSQ